MSEYIRFMCHVLCTWHMKRIYSDSKVMPLSAIVKAHLITARPTSCGCKQGCSDQRCGCRKGNVECSSYCHRGRACTNQPTEDSGKPPLRATSHRRLASSQITSQPKRPRQETKPQSSIQPHSATANEEGNQSSPPQRLRKSKERRTTERARLAQAGEI